MVKGFKLPSLSTSAVGVASQRECHGMMIMMWRIVYSRVVQQTEQNPHIWNAVYFLDFLIHDQEHNFILATACCESIWNFEAWDLLCSTSGSEMSIILLRCSKATWHFMTIKIACCERKITWVGVKNQRRKNHKVLPIKTYQNTTINSIYAYISYWYTRHFQTQPHFQLIVSWSQPSVALPSRCRAGRSAMGIPQVPSRFHPMHRTNTQWPFQEPKLEGNIATKYGLIWYRTSILGSWNSHWNTKPWFLWAYLIRSGWWWLNHLEKYESQWEELSHIWNGK